MYLYSRKDFLILGENGGNGDSGLVFNIVFPDKTVKTIVLEKDKYYLESIVKDETLKLQEDYYQKLIDNYAGLRNFKHDIKAHYHVMYKLLENNKHDDAKIYLENIFEKISSVDVYSTNNLYISSILNSFDQTFIQNLQK